MRTRRLRLTALLGALILATTSVRAGRVLEARPHRDDGWLAVSVRTDHLLDQRTRSTVESGLPGSARLLLELRDGSNEVAARRAIERVLEFDLWEGVARVRDGLDETVYPTIAAADSAWAHFESIRLLPIDRVERGVRYRVWARIEVESFGSEERERVSRYVSESSRGDRRELAFDLGGLVGRLVGSGGDDDTVWQSPDFRLGELPEADEPR